MIKLLSSKCNQLNWHLQNTYREKIDFWLTMVIIYACVSVTMSIIMKTSVKYTAYKSELKLIN